MSADPAKPERSMPSGSLGTVIPQKFHIPELHLQSGDVLKPVTIQYETYGRLNSAGSNAVLICHAFSGSANAAGYLEGESRPGWWNDMIGPGRAFDTDVWFVISTNVIGSCYGSTGPSDLNPETGRHYGMDFPPISIRDMIEPQRLLIDSMGIDKLACVAGGSMGGMQVLQWLVAYPDRVLSAIPVATTAKHSHMQIAFNEVGREAIRMDPGWHGGQYYGSDTPIRGLAVARMVGHITYMSDSSMEEKLRNRAESQQGDFKIRSYLVDKSERFMKRFDANSYIYITKAMDSFDLTRNQPLHEQFRGLQARTMVLSYTSDWLYPAYQSLDIVRALKMAGAAATYVEIESRYGHDAFLVEIARQSELIGNFMSYTGKTLDV